MSHVKIARYWKKGETRWRWSLYYSPYSGHGVRFVRRYQEIHSRWYMFFDLPVIGGLELYVQDVDAVEQPLAPDAAIACPQCGFVHSDSYCPNCSFGYS